MQCKVIGAFFEAAEALSLAGKEPWEHAGHVLYRSELLLLETIHRRPRSNAVELAEEMHVTRGAITQLGNKLQEKRLIERYSLPENKKEKYYRLTDAGESLRLAREQQHAFANAQIREYLGTLNERDIEVITTFLQTIHACAPFSLFDCVCAHNAGEDIAKEALCWS